MSDGSEKRPLTKMLWSVSIKTRTFASVNICNGSFQSCLKLLKQYRTIEEICSDGHSITLITQENANVIVKPIRLGKTISLLAACDIPLELEFRFEYGCKKDT